MKVRWEIERYHCQGHRREMYTGSRCLKRSRESKRRSRNSIFAKNGNTATGSVRPIETRNKLEARERKRRGRRRPGFLEAYYIGNVGGNCR